MFAKRTIRGRFIDLKNAEEQRLKYSGTIPKTEPWMNSADMRLTDSFWPAKIRISSVYHNVMSAGKRANVIITIRDRFKCTDIKW
jgi:hypothetical protein